MSGHSRDSERRSARRLRRRHGRALDPVAESQRWRLLEAAAAVLLARGYAATTSRRIADHAGVSPVTFYDHFEDADSCLLAAHAMAIDVLWELIAAACAGAGAWPERLRAALVATVGFLVAEPSLARLLCADVAAGIPAVAVAQQRLLERLAGLLSSGRGVSLESSVGLPSGAETHLIGAVFALLADRIAASDMASLPALSPELGEILGRPYCAGV